MSGPFAIIALLPESVAGRMDFVSKEFATIEDVTAVLAELEAREPRWRCISFVHIEDLPLLTETPIGWPPV